MAKKGKPGLVLDPEVARQRIAALEGSECSCTVCRHMCERRPCWGTPEDIKKILDYGFGLRLMRDYWSGGVNTDVGSIDIISPAIVGCEGGSAPSWPSGRCTFLTDEGLCELHDLGLKPIEGRAAHHDTIAQGPHPDLHRMVAALWETEDGQAVVTEWHRVVGWEWQQVHMEEANG